MSFKIRITLGASSDEEDAYNYYEDKRKGLGEEFLEELTKKYKSISAHPELYSFIDNRRLLRDVKIDRFPYVIIYETREDTVFI